MKTINLSLWLLLFVSPILLATPTQSLQAIQDSVNSFVKSSLQPDGNYEITAAQIDSRLQLPACEQNLDVFVQSGEIKAGRNTLGIRCNGLSPWTIYSTVLIKEFRNILIANKQLDRNELISQGHISSEIRDVSTLQQGYLIEPAEIINKQATRFIPSGSVLYRMHYTEPTLIKRGERVNIQSGRPGLMITSSGEAMMDGIKGQQIRVKNVSSNRVIQATVTATNVVTVNF
ncbi:flagellar biosynthesis protein FlgA [Methylomonas lenta]|uniref:Flagella basal body P-ring formation protein FlgA n=1 Tax=Methylomonas lenta TaxID=980561 RepID=A0A177N4S0_9GAMM|nr:flagellar basal body P-ring formation chaperone FlgA [Methylomonas lenta]OAI12845.1 flagellar biosynthesis protein FlgA [Methylomonas lenta]